MSQHCCGPFQDRLSVVSLPDSARNSGPAVIGIVALKALIKIIYLATIEASKKWTMPIKDWKNCMSQFAIYFDDRVESEMAV